MRNHKLKCLQRTDYMVKQPHRKHATCHISKQRILQLSSHHLRTTLTVRREEAQDKNRMPTSKHRHCSHTPYEERDSWSLSLPMRCWNLMTKMSYFSEPRLIHSSFPHRKMLNSLPWGVWLSLCFDVLPPSSLLQNLCVSWFLPYLLGATSGEIWEAVPGLSFQFCLLNKQNSQLLYCTFLSVNRTPVRAGRLGWMGTSACPEASTFKRTSAFSENQTVHLWTGSLTSCCLGWKTCLYLSSPCILQYCSQIPHTWCLYFILPILWKQYPACVSCLHCFPTEISMSFPLSSLIFFFYPVGLNT